MMMMMKQSEDIQKNDHHKQCEESIHPTTNTKQKKETLKILWRVYENLIK